MLILVYVLDSLRADHLSCYGYERNTSPNIDRLVNDGVLFQNSFVPSTWTRPVAASILSGAYPSVHGVQTRTHRFSPSIIRLPELLQKDGFDTLAISAMANISIAGGFAKGFNEFIELFRDKDLLGQRQITTAVEEGLTHLDGDSPIALPRSKDINRYFLRWLEGSKSDQKFAFLWSIDTHAPYNPPSEFDRFSDRDYQGTIDGSRASIRRATEQDAPRLVALYDGEILYNDHYIGQLVNELKRLGLFDDTLLIVTGDHGEAFFEHGLLSHGNIPYEELIRVPLIVKFPENRFAGTRVDALVELMDLVPTILEWTAAKDYQSLVESIQGKSLLPLITGKHTETHPYVFSETNSLDFQNTYLSVRDRRWKYIESRLPKRSLRTLKSLLSYLIKQRMFLRILQHPLWFLKRHVPRQSEMLFDLQSDPSEQQDLMTQEHEHAARLKRELLNWRNRNQTIAQSIDLEPYTFEEDREIQQHLKELGYL